MTPRLIVELYEGWAFSGKRAVVADSEPNIRRIGMRDRVFSARVFKGPGFEMSPNQKAILCDREEYDGNRIALGPGFYPNLQDLAKRFGSVRSIRFESAMEVGGPEWGDIPVVIETFNQDRFGGRKQTIIRDVANTREIGQFNTISSLRIHKGPNFPRGGCRVTLYSEPGFAGLRTPIEMRPVDHYKEFADLAMLPQSFGNRISSISISGWSERSEFDVQVFEDRFDGDRLNPTWEWRDPRGGGDWRASQGFLRMNVQSGQDLWHGANYDAPRIVRPMGGDFAIETRLPVELSSMREHGGLLVWKNEHRFVRLEKTCRAHAFRGDVRFERHQWQSYELIGRGADMQSARQLFLRLERKGDVFTGHASEDGEHWQLCGSTVMGMSDPVSVGLHALAPGNVPPTVTNFAYFRVYKRRRDVAANEKAQSRSERVRSTWRRRRTLDSMR